jgi:hypothetical protein
MTCGKIFSARPDPSSGTNTIFSSIRVAFSPASAGRINSNGLVVVWATLVATLPSNQRRAPDSPCVAMAMIQAGSLLARSTITSAAFPTPQRNRSEEIAVKPQQFVANIRRLEGVAKRACVYPDR